MTQQSQPAPTRRRGIHLSLGAAFLLAVSVLVGVGPVQPASAAAAHQYQEAANGLEQEDALVFLARRKGTMFKYDKDGYKSATAWLVPDSIAAYADKQVILISDDQSDGRRVGVHWRTADGTISGLCVVSAGKSGEAGRSKEQICVTDVPEGKRVEYRLGTCDGSKKNCGNAQDWWNNIGNWSWNTLNQPPKSVNGWRDLPDDADATFEHDDCNEDSDLDC